MDIKKNFNNIRRIQLGQLEPNAPFKYLPKKTPVGYTALSSFSPYTFYNLFFDYKLLDTNSDRDIYDKFNYLKKKVRNLLGKDSIENSEIDERVGDQLMDLFNSNVYLSNEYKNIEKILKKKPDHNDLWCIFSKAFTEEEVLKNDTFKILKIIADIFSKLECERMRFGNDWEKKFSEDEIISDEAEKKLLAELEKDLFNNYDLSLAFWFIDNCNGKNKPEQMCCHLLEGGLYVIKRFYGELKLLDNWAPIFSVEDLLSSKKKPISNFFDLLIKRQGYKNQKEFICKFTFLFEEKGIGEEILKKYLNGSKHLSVNKFIKIMEVFHSDCIEDEHKNCDKVAIFMTFFISRLLTYFADIFQAMMIGKEKQGDFPHAQSVLIERWKLDEAIIHYESLTCVGQFDPWQDYRSP